MQPVSTQHGKRRNKSKNTVTRSRLMESAGTVVYSKAERKAQRQRKSGLQPATNVARNFAATNLWRQK